MSSREIPFIFGGRRWNAFNGIGELPVGWLRMLYHLESFTLESYLVGLVHSIGDKTNQAIKPSHTLDDESIKEIQQKLANPGAPPPTSDLLPLAPRGISTIWIVDRTLNAWASRLSSRYVVAIHIAMPILLRRFYQELIKHSDFFPEVEGIAQSRLGRKPNFDSFDLTMINRDLSLEEAMWWALDMPPGSAAVEKRMVLAELLTYMSIVVFIAHEVAHILSGHCDALYSTGIREVWEYQDKYIDEPRVKVDETAILMEVEADIVSMNILVDFVRSQSYKRNFQHYLNALSWDWDESLLAGLLNLCLSPLYTVLGVLSLTGGDKHPHPTTREFLIAWALEALYGRRGISRDAFLSGQYWGRFETSKRVALNLVPYRAAWGISNVFDRVGKYWNEAHQLISQLEKRRSQWNNYSFVGEAQRIRPTE